MRRGVRWHATAKTFFGGTGAGVAQRPQGGRTWILPREPLDHRCNEGHRRRRDGGRDGGHGHEGQGLSRASGRAGEKEGPSPGKSTKPTPKAWASEARGLNIAGRAAPQGFMRRAMPPEFSPAADAAGAVHLSPCPQAPQGQLWGGRYPAPSITLPKRSQLCPFQRCNCIWRMTL